MYNQAIVFICIQSLALESLPSACCLYYIQCSEPATPAVIVCCELPLDQGVTLVCQSDPTWYKSDPKSTSSRRLVPKTT